MSVEEEAGEREPIAVEADVKIIPEKRTATYSVPLDGMAHLSRHKMHARVNLKSITLGGSADIPKTLEAIDAIAALVAAVRDELVAQGVTE